MMDKENKKDIRSLSVEELREFFIKNSHQAFRGNQVYKWLWQKGIHKFEGMTNLSKSTRELLKEHFVINHVAIDLQQKSKDGTIKNRVKLFDQFIVESVLIPTAARTTASEAFGKSPVSKSHAPSRKGPRTKIRAFSLQFFEK